MAATLTACFLCAGQSCTAGERILVQRGIYDAYVEKLRRAVTEQIVLGDPLAAETTMGPLNNEGVARKMDEHVAELNNKYNTTAVRVAPVGQAVVKLRARIIAGDAPGLKDQNDLFADPIGHAKAPLQALVAYCYYGLIYEKSPVGLPAPAVIAKAKESDKLNRLLQEIAWEAVTSHPQSGVKASNR